MPNRFPYPNYLIRGLILFDTENALASHAHYLIRKTIWHHMEIVL